MTNMITTREAYIVDGVRSAIASFGGSLKDTRADDLAALVISSLISRQPEGLKEQISDVIFGCANQAGEDNRNVARMAALLAGLPERIPGETVNRLCASGMSALVNAARAIKLSEGDLYIAGGVEQMTRAPYVLSKSDKAFARNVELFDTSLGWRFINPKMRELYGVDSMGETAENVAEKYSISRQDQDLFAFRSQQKAKLAQSKRRFESEIVAINVLDGKTPREFVADEFIRPDTTLETLAKLKAVFKKNGTVTAGNASGINDGACAVLLSSEVALKRFSLKPLAKILGSEVVGVEPRLMGIGPVTATKQLLKRFNLGLDQISVIELNEAFAAQGLACLRELGLSDDDARVNINGGAIALGHPLGMSGARLLLTAARELELRKERYALCTMCVGVGQGMATLIERV